MTIKYLRDHHPAKPAVYKVDFATGVFELLGVTCLRLHDLGKTGKFNPNGGGKAFRYMTEVSADQA